MAVQTKDRNERLAEEQQKLEQIQVAIEWKRVEIDQSIKALQAEIKKVSEPMRLKIKKLLEGLEGMDVFLEMLSGPDKTGQLDNILKKVNFDLLGEFTKKVSSLSDNLKEKWEWERLEERVEKLRNNLKEVSQKTRQQIDDLQIDGIGRFIKVLKVVESEGVRKNPETVETPVDMFKLPIRSVKGIFKEEIERSLLERADEDGQFSSGILDLRKQWWKLSELYNEHSLSVNIDATLDWFDDNKFTAIMGDLVATRHLDRWETKDLAGFVVDSRKVIDALKRRIKIKEKGAETETTEKKQITQLKETLKKAWFVGNLSNLDTEWLIKLTRGHIEKQTDEISTLKTKQEGKLSRLRWDLSDKKNDRIRIESKIDQIPWEKKALEAKKNQLDLKIKENQREIEGLPEKEKNQIFEITSEYEVGKKKISTEKDELTQKKEEYEESYRTRIEEADEKKDQDALKAERDRAIEKIKWKLKSLNDELEWKDQQHADRKKMIKQDFVREKKDLERDISGFEDQKAEIDGKISGLDTDLSTLETKRNAILRDESELKKSIVKAEDDQTVSVASSAFEVLKIQVDALEETHKTWGVDDILENNPDLKTIQDLEDNIAKIKENLKIDGEKSLSEVQNEITEKYDALAVKQRKLANKLLNPKWSQEEREKLDQEIAEARADYQQVVFENIDADVNEEIMQKIQRQEWMISDYLDELYADPQVQPLLVEVRRDPTAKNIRAFHENKKVARLRKLHQGFGAFQNAGQEQKYIEFMFAGNPNLLKKREQVATFHSLNHARTLQNAFGNPTDSFHQSLWSRGGQKLLDVMWQLADDNAEGLMKYTKSTLDALGSMGYGAMKVSAHYPAKWLGNLSGKTLSWMQAEAKNKKGLTGLVNRFCKFPFRLASIPAYVALKPAEVILNEAANFVGGELTVEGVSKWHFDNFVANIVGKEKVESLWDAVFQLTTCGIGLPCEFGSAKWKSHTEKKKELAKYFKGKTIEEAIKQLQALSVNSGNLSFWHGKY